MLASEIARMDARQNLMSNIAETNFPDVELPDMFGRKVRLSSLQGKVVLVDFWSAELGNSNAINAELKEVYAEYADRDSKFTRSVWMFRKISGSTPCRSSSFPGFRFAISGDEILPHWGFTTCRNCLLTFLIDREGIVVARDLYGTGLQRALEAQFE